MVILEYLRTTDVKKIQQGRDTDFDDVLLILCDLAMFCRVPAEAFLDIITIVNALLREKNEGKYKKIGINLALNLLNNGLNSDLTLLLLSRLNLLSFFS